VNRADYDAQVRKLVGRTLAAVRYHEVPYEDDEGNPHTLSLHTLSRTA
jgi:hypothetical protein